MDGWFILGIIFFAAGFILIGIEAVIPGFGLPGVLGICALAAGVLLTADTLTQALVIIAIVMVLLAAGLFILMRLFAKGRVKPPVVLEDRLDKESGCISSSGSEYFIGRKGIAMTDLRPAGKALIDGAERDVVSETRFISKGTEIEVCRISNTSLIVREQQAGQAL